MLLFGQASGASPQAGGGFSMIIMMAVIFAIFYFIVIRPAKNKQKSHQQLVSSLKGGERIVTSGGIYGTISRVMDDRFEIEIGKNIKILVAKPSISTVIDETNKPKS